jgi:hypothetical protein
LLIQPAIYDETEEELSQNVKKLGIQAHGYTEHTWKKQVAKNGDHLRRTSSKRKKAKHAGPGQRKAKTKSRQ